MPYTGEITIRMITQLYQSLQSFDEKLGTLYADGAFLIGTNLKTRGYLIANVGRNILDYIKKSDDDWGEDNLDKCRGELWLIMGNFHGLAHRKGICDEVIDTKQVLKVWREMESKLAEYFGEYDGVDHQPRPRSAGKEIFHFSDKQEDIRGGLREICERSALFFEEAMKLWDSGLEWNSSHIGHLFRELDGSIKSWLENRKYKVKVPMKGENGRLEAILTSLGQEVESSFSQKWFLATEGIDLFAHVGFDSDPRVDLIRLSEQWDNYQEVLIELIGGKFEMLDRIDRILDYPSPRGRKYGGLNWVFEKCKDPIFAWYFFSRLDHEKMEWFIALYEKGFFDGELNPIPYENPEKKGSFKIHNWMALSYLLKAAKTKENIVLRRLPKIIKGIFTYETNNGERILNSLTDHRLLELISLVPETSFDEEMIDFVEKILLRNISDEVLIPHVIREDLLVHLSQFEDSEHYLKLLDFILDFKENEVFLIESFLGVNIHYLVENILGQLPSGIEEKVFDLVLSKARGLRSSSRQEMAIGQILDEEISSPSQFQNDYGGQLIVLARKLLLRLDSERLNQKVPGMLEDNVPAIQYLAMWVYQNAPEILSKKNLNDISGRKAEIEMRIEEDWVVKSKFQSGHISPLSTEELSMKSPRDLVKYLNEYQSPEKVWIGDADRRGLCDEFAEMLKEKHDFFERDPEAFESLHPEFVRRLVDSWTLDCSDKKLVERVKFLSNFISKFESQNLAELLKSLVRFLIRIEGKKVRALPKARVDLVLLLIQFIPNDEYRYEKLIDNARNMASGMIWQVFFLTLNSQSILSQKKLGRQLLKPLKENLLAAENTDCFNFWFGDSLPKTLRNYPQWAKKQLILHAQDNQGCSSILYGYLVWHQSPDQKTFNFLRKLKYYQSSISSSLFVGKEISRIVFRHCLIAGFESDHEEFGKYLMPLEAGLGVVSLVNYALMEAKIVAEWGKDSKPEKTKALVEQVVSWSPKCPAKEWGRLVLLVEFVSELDGNVMTWARKSLPFLEANFVKQVLKSLGPHFKEQPKEVGELFLFWLENGRTPTYPEKTIQDFVGKLFELGAKSQAKSICDFYAGQGYLFLRESYKDWKEK